LPSYAVKLNRQAEKIYRWLARKEPELYLRIARAFVVLAQDPHRGKPLKGELKGHHSYRVGNYRIIYLIEYNQLMILVVDIGHRREIYR
jgi:mRNA interferase RelE/StbE